MCRKGISISTSDDAGVLQYSLSKASRTPDAKLWNLEVDSVTLFWPLQIIVWCLGWQLVLLGPVTNSIKVSTCVDGVEVDEGLDGRVRGLVPDLTQYTDVNIAHQLLANDVEAVRCESSKQLLSRRQQTGCDLLTCAFRIRSSFAKGPIFIAL